jgi:phosphoribosyl 1,2-cyclic phosphodiesterase
LKVRILGCGTSTGVPKIGNDWGQCDPKEPRNYRLRTSILVESRSARMLVDCGPDLRRQLLSSAVNRLDGVLGWARELRIGQLYLVHMGNGLDYRSLVAELPDWAAPAYDGLEIAS